jgi:hypothetical protein
VLRATDADGMVRNGPRLLLTVVLGGEDAKGVASSASLGQRPRADGGDENSSAEGATHFGPALGCLSVPVEAASSRALSSFWSWRA